MPEVEEQIRAYAIWLVGQVDSASNSPESPIGPEDGLSGRRTIALLGAAAVVGLLVVGGLAWIGQRSSEETPAAASAIESSLSQPAVTSQVAPTSTSTISTSSTTPTVPSSTTTSRPSPEPLSIESANAVAATAMGVLLDDGSNAWNTPLLKDETLGLPLLIDDSVVYQANDGENPPRPTGPLLIVDATGTREFDEGPDRLVVLHDVGDVGGRPTILASSTFALPANPQQADHRLLLIDLASLETTNLGSFGGWESAVLEGRFVDGAISLLRSESTARWLEIIEIDGAARHSIELPSDTDLHLADSGASIWVLEPRFVGDDFAPMIRLRSINVTSAAVEESELVLVPDGLQVVGAYCGRAEITDSTLLCNQDSGPPISVEMIGPAIATPIPGLANGVVTARANG